MKAPSKWLAFVFVVLVLATLMPIVVAPAAAANPDATDWIPDQKVYDTAQNERRPSIATDSNGYLWVAYECYNNLYAKYDLKVAKSTDGGTSWSVVHTASSHSSYQNIRPSIAVDTTRNWVYVVYECEYTTPAVSNIYLYRYNGTSWQHKIVDGYYSHDDHNPSIVCEYDYGSSNALYIVWERRVSASDCDIIFAKSSDYGDTWTQNTLYDTPDISHQPSITYADNWIYVAFRNATGTAAGDICLTRSGNRGVSWYTALNIDGVANDCSEPSFTATHGGGVVVVAYVYEYNMTNDDIRYVYSLYYGQSWFPASTLADSGANERWPHLTVDGMGKTTNYVGDIHVTYIKLESTGTRTYAVDYRKANCGNPTSWSSAVQVADDTAKINTDYPTLSDRAITTVHDSVPVVVWTDFRSGYDNNDIYATTLGGKYTIDTSPSGLQVRVDGVYYSAPVSFWWPLKTVHQLYAPSPQGLHTFVRWSDGGKQTHLVTADALTEELILAYYTPSLTLSLSPTTVPRGSPLTISGQLTPGKATSISLYYRIPPSVTWALAATIPTNAAGTYKVTVTVPTSLPTGTYDLVAVWYDSTTNRYAVSAIKKLTIT